MKRKASFFIFLFTILNIIAAILLVAAYAASWVNPANMWFFAFFGLSYPYILILNLFFILLWLILRRWQILLSLLLLLAGWDHLMSLYPVRIGSRDSAKGNHVKVLSYNVHRLYGKELKAKKNNTRSLVTDFLAGQNADILLLQEFYASGEEYMKVIDRFRKAIGLEYYTYMNYHGKPSGRKINAIAIFSRYPLVHSGFVKNTSGPVFAVYADILFHGDTVRVYNLHLESIRFGNEDYSFYSNLTEPDKELESPPFGEGSKRLLWKLRKAFIIRGEQVSTLTSHFKTTSNPVILGGDFNDTPFSYTYNQLTKTLNDSFREAGSGFVQPTYAGKFPSFRIDYILHSSHFQALEYSRNNVSLSDHFPVKTTLIYNNKH